MLGDQCLYGIFRVHIGSGIDFDDDQSVRCPVQIEQILHGRRLRRSHPGNDDGIRPLEVMFYEPFPNGFVEVNSTVSREIIKFQSRT
jgi:hypothetical protein